MRRIIGVSIAAFALASSVLAQSGGADNGSLKESLMNLEKQSWEAWKKRDGKFFQQFLSDDHVEVGVNGPATKAQVVAFVGSPICAIRWIDSNWLYSTQTPPC